MELPQGGTFKAELLKCVRLLSRTALCRHTKGGEEAVILMQSPGENKAHIIFPRKALSIIDKESAFRLLKVQVCEAPLSSVIRQLRHGWTVFQYLSHISRAQYRQHFRGTTSF